MFYISYYEWERLARWKMNLGQKINLTISPRLVRLDNFLRRTFAEPWKRRSVQVPRGWTGKTTFWANSFDITIPRVPWEVAPKIMTGIGAWRNWVCDAMGRDMPHDLCHIFYGDELSRMKMRVIHTNGEARFVMDMTWEVNARYSKLDSDRALGCAVFIPETREKKEIVKGLSVGERVRGKKDLKKILGKIYPYISGAIAFTGEMLDWKNPACMTGEIPPLLGVFWPNPHGEGCQHVLCEMTHRGVNILGYEIVETAFVRRYFDPIGTLGRHSTSFEVPVKTFLKWRR